jgi:hypothetical protein
MKGPFWLAALGAACIANGASAATIIQFDSEQGGSFGFQGFDGAKGTLNKVTLQVAINKSRVWLLNVPSSRPTTGSVDWSVDGVWRFDSTNPALGNPLVALTGTGSSVVALSQVFDGRAFGYFAVTASGMATLDFDPAQFVGRYTRFNGFDLGYLPNLDRTGDGRPDPSDTTITRLPAGGQAFQLDGGACFVRNGNPVQQAEDLCGSTNYTLTYDYTPAVPEPATWAMMIAGFAVTGVALRRRRPHQAVSA